MPLHPFAHVNDGNAVMPFAKGFGWGGELNPRILLREAVRLRPRSGRYPKRAGGAGAAQQEDPRRCPRRHLQALIQCLKSIDRDLLKGAVAGEKFSELFFRFLQGRKSWLPTSRPLL